MGKKKVIGLTLLGLGISVVAYAAGIDRVIRSKYEDKQTVFKGNDGGTEITSGVIDWASGGTWSFTGADTTISKLILQSTSDQKLTFNDDGGGAKEYAIVQTPGTGLRFRQTTDSLQPLVLDETGGMTISGNVNGIRWGSVMFKGGSTYVTKGMIALSGSSSLGTGLRQINWSPAFVDGDYMCTVSPHQTDRVCNVEQILTTSIRVRCETPAGAAADSNWNMVCMGEQ